MQVLPAFLVSFVFTQDGHAQLMHDIRNEDGLKGMVQGGMRPYCMKVALLLNLIS